MLDGAAVEIVGLVTEYGREAPQDPFTGSFVGGMGPITNDDRGGVPPELLEGYLGTPPRCEVRPYRDGRILVFFYDHATGALVRGVMTVETEGDAIRHARSYFFSPDVIAEVAAELALPFRVNGYRYWLERP